MTESRPGKSHAVAAAVAAASGDVLAFTDDDVTVDPSWIASIRHIMRDSNAALVGGPVFPRWEASPPRWLRFETSVDTREYGRLAAPLGLLNYGPASIELGPRTVLGANRRPARSLWWEGSPATGKLRARCCRERTRLCQRAAADSGRCAELRVAHWVPVERCAGMAFRPAEASLATLDASSIRTAAAEARHFKRALIERARHWRGRARQPAQLMDSAADVASSWCAARRWEERGCVRERLFDLRPDLHYDAPPCCAESSRHCLMHAPDACSVEIIVVDNNSTDETAPSSPSPSGTRASRDPHSGRQQGKSFALNAGLAAACGDVLALTTTTCCRPKTGSSEQAPHAGRDVRVRQGAAAVAERPTAGAAHAAGACDLKPAGDDRLR
jgi:hypothetical protein